MASSPATAGSVATTSGWWRAERRPQPKRRDAQEQLCRKLTGLGAKIRDGKWFRMEVSDTPL